ncbi:MAG: phosphoglycerate kinase [Nitrososphaerota archaeon]
MGGVGGRRFLTLDDFDVKGKRVAARIDVNSSLDPITGRIQINERFRAHAQTIRELMDKGARVVILAHQGRPGEPDFTDLSQHAQILEACVGREIRFIPDIVGDNAIHNIKSLAEGEALLLDNVRMIDEEVLEKSGEAHAGSIIPRRLAPLLDLFILDAFSVAHRAHSTVVGLAWILPTCAGRVLERELRSLESLLPLGRRLVFVMGGNKPRECVKVLSRFVQAGDGRVEILLSGGILAQLFVIAGGRSLGGPSEEYLARRKHLVLLENVHSLQSQLGEALKTPIDFAYEAPSGEREEISVEDLPADGVIYDIGCNTADLYGSIIRDLAEDVTVVVKGPPGAYERGAFRRGTEMVYRSLSRTRAATLIGGGDSVTVIEKMGMRLSDFTYVSLGGGALISFLSGEHMPGLSALERWAQHHRR